MNNLHKHFIAMYLQYLNDVEKEYSFSDFRYISKLSYKSFDVIFEKCRDLKFTKINRKTYLLEISKLGKKWLKTYKNSWLDEELQYD